MWKGRERKTRSGRRKASLVLAQSDYKQTNGWLWLHNPQMILCRHKSELFCNLGRLSHIFESKHGWDWQSTSGSSEPFLFAASGVALLLPRQSVSASKWAANLMRQSTHQHKTNISSLSHSSSWFILSFPLSTQDNFSKRNPTKSCSNFRTQCDNSRHQYLSLIFLRIFSHSSPVSYRTV